MAKQPVTKSIINTFSKGMNKDLDKSLRPNNTYFNARNLRVVATDLDTTGALENVKGNLQIIDTNADNGNGMPSTYYVIGTKKIEDWLVIWTTTNDDTTEGAGASAIFAFKISDGIAATNSAVALYSGTLTNYPFCVYDDSGNDLNLSTQSRIKAIASVEASDVAKIYWCDGDRNEVRWFNLYDSDLPNQSVDKFDLIPDVSFVSPSIVGIINGDINCGTISYSYQLYKNKGSETLYSPLSNTVHLTPSGEGSPNSLNYEGGQLNENSGKGVSISIANTTTGFNRIRGIAIHWSSLNTTPQIRIFANQAIDSDASSTIILNDIGTNLGTLEYEELSALNRSLFSCSDLASKDEYLFACDIEEEIFDTSSYDARAYRFDSNGDSLIGHAFEGSYTSGSHPLLGASTSWPDGTSDCLHLATTDGTNWTEYYDNAGTATVTGNSYTTSTIPETYDAINFYNDYDNDSSATYDFPYKYQSDGSTLGGEGPNIEYSFVDSQDFIINYDADGAGAGKFAGGTLTVYDTTDADGYTSYAQPIRSGLHRGHMRDEIYRYGIKFLDDKGRSSFVNWIGDIRTPTHYESYITDLISQNTTARPLAIAFNVKSLPSGYTGYVIVRKRRDGFENRNILAQGILSAASLSGTTETPEEFHVSSQTIVSVTEHVFLNSPEISVNQNLDFSSGDELVCVAEIDVSTTAEYESDATTITDARVTQIINWQPISLATTSIEDVQSARIIGPGENSYNIGGTNTVQTYNYATDDWFKGTSLLVRHSGTAGWLPIWAGTSTNTRFLVNYRRNNWDTQYGGNTYLARSRNVYEVAATMKLTNVGTTTVHGGDTFITMFDNHHTVSKIANITGNYKCEVVYFPVESTINCELRHDDSFKRKWQVANANMIQETGGTHTDGSSVEYEQETDLYQYNTVYSQENTGVAGIAKPEASVYNLYNDYPNRVKYSDRKIDGEVSDSWLKFRSNNFFDLEREYGSVNNLRVYKNSLHFWQDSAFGVLSVNPRALLSSEEGTGIVLGTGGFLDRSDYVTRTIGNTNKFGIAVTDEAMYWLDNDHKDMIRYVAGTRGSYSLGSTLESLSFKHGMDRSLRRLGYIVDAQLAYDRVNSEIIVTVTKGRRGTVGTGSGVDYVALDSTGIDDTDFAVVKDKYYYISATDVGEIELKGITDFYSAGETIYVGAEEDKATFSFLEKLNVFNSFYSFTPGIYNDEFEYIISNAAASTTSMWCHEKGNRGQFYNTYYDSTLSATFNPEFPYTKVFDNLLWYSEVLDESGSNNINRFSDTWDKIHFYNDYQTSTDLVLGFRSGGLPYDRRERGFACAVPRSAVDVDVSSNLDKFANVDTTLKRRERMRDKYVSADFTYINSSDNYRFICPYLIMKYRRSIR